MVLNAMENCHCTLTEDNLDPHNSVFAASTNTYRFSAMKHIHHYYATMACSAPLISKMSHQRKVHDSNLTDRRPSSTTILGNLHIQPWLQSAISSKGQCKQHFTTCRYGNSTSGAVMAMGDNFQFPYCIWIPNMAGKVYCDQYAIKCLSKCLLEITS